MNILIENLFKSKDLNFKLSEDALMFIVTWIVIFSFIVLPETLNQWQELVVSIINNTIYEYKYLMTVFTAALAYSYVKQWFGKDGLKSVIFSVSVMSLGEFLFEQHTIL
jgi:hypothetical protein